MPPLHHCETRKLLSFNFHVSAKNEVNNSVIYSHVVIVIFTGSKAKNEPRMTEHEL